MESRLEHQLMALERLQRQERLWRKLARFWAFIGIAGLLTLAIQLAFHQSTIVLWWTIVTTAIVGALFISGRERRRQPDLSGLVKSLEREHPEFRYLLSTAAEQQPDPVTGQFHFLQLRVIGEILAHRQRWVWHAELRRKRASARRRYFGAAVVALVVFAFGFRPTARDAHPVVQHSAELSVAPGDTQIERGTGVVISARFGGEPPTSATLVVVPADGETRRIPLERHLSDPVFGASLFDVTQDTVYRVEYDSEKSRDYKITVFEFPALVRADAALEFPAYTGLTNRTIPDTLRVSAVEGSRLSYSLELNKPVASARLVGKAPSTAPIDLAVHTNAAATLNELVLTQSGRYALELVDHEGRTNKVPADFSFQALTNRRPELRFASPRGDTRVSLIEEVQIQAEVSDDFGVIRSGIGFGVAGQDPKLIELQTGLKPNEKQPLAHLLALEGMGVGPDNVVAYFAWADDFGPDGEPRRTLSDIYFAEIRPFDEIFREDQSGMAGGQGEQQEQQGQNGQGGGAETTELAELQKQIVIATWKLQQQKPVAVSAPGNP